MLYQQSGRFLPTLRRMSCWVYNERSFSEIKPERSSCRPADHVSAGFLTRGGVVRSRPVHGGERTISAQELRLNEEIRISRCRLIGVDGTQIGIFAITDAQRYADEEGYDLVEIAPDADPPVCRVMDYSKYKYEQEMKAKAARKKQTKAELKEMKFRPKIDTGDYETKKKHILRFIESGAKVKVTIMFRGREMAHPEIGLNILEKLAEDLRGQAIVENQPKLEGRNMFMLIAPQKKRESTKTSSVVSLGDAASGVFANAATGHSENIADDSFEEDLYEDSYEDIDGDADEDSDDSDYAENSEDSDESETKKKGIV